MPAKPTIIITGASGFLGAELVKHFAAKGWKVIGLVRGADTYQMLGVDYCEFDLSQPFDDLIFAGADYMVHAAYIKFDRQHPDAFEQNLSGAKGLLAASRKYRLKKNIFISTMSAHEGAVSVYGRQKLAIEQLFVQPQDVVIRSGMIIGQGGIVREMADFMRSKHLVPLVSGGTQPLQIIGVYDLVRVVERALTTGVSGLFTVATPRVYRYREFYQTLASSLGVPVLMVPVPYWLLLGLLRLAGLLHVQLGVSEDNLRGLRKLQSAPTEGDLKRLGVTLDELDQALARTGITPTLN